MRGVALLFLVAASSQVILASPVDNTNSLVVSSTEPSKEEEPTKDVKTEVNPKIYSMNIESNITNRFATTLVTSKVRNLKKEAAETTFSVILPENAFISQFEMEIGGKVYKAYVKEKEEAKKIYEQAVASGQSAAHVELSARDSETFTVSVNIEPESKTIFRLTYEELLQRQNGQYELVINIHPGQIVEDLKVNVFINESRPLTFVRTPSLRTGNEISKNEEELKPSADIQIDNGTSANVVFTPDAAQQKEFAQHLGGKKENGLAGQFVVQYDVERDPHGGEVLVRDGYFVHFFSPSELKPLQKHVVFVLDHSGSMWGRKFEQLTEAMKNILSQLGSDDLFNIVRFNEGATVWNVTENKFDHVDLNPTRYGELEPQLRELNLPQAVEGNEENTNKAKQAIEDQSEMGATNIIFGLEVGLFLIKRTQEQFPKKYQPMVIFLTDGLPNVGLNFADEIAETTSRLNSGQNKAAIFSLSFGYGADKDLLRKVSAQNLGFSRHIYEAADSSLQLQDFYKTISSPLLSNIIFKYVDSVTSVTKTHHPILFRGSELVVAGKIDGSNPNILRNVLGVGSIGPLEFTAPEIHPVTSLERLWAYLTVKQILNERETADKNKTELTKKALDLALKYSFVTSVSSLVVVKPNKTDAVENQHVTDRPNGFALPQAFAGPLSIKGGLASYRPPHPGLGIPAPAPSFATGWGGGLGAPVQTADSLDADAYSTFEIETEEAVTPYLTTTASYPTSDVPTTSVPLSSASPGSVTANAIEASIPSWLENIKNNNENITTPQGIFYLSKVGDVTSQPPCPETHLNTTGICTPVLDCPEIFTVLSDLAVYLQYFCPLDKYAGVCCPRISATPVP